MRVHRRGFIAALFAPFVARFLPKEQPPGRKDFIEFKDWFRIETRPSDYYEVAPNPGLYGLKYYAAVPSNLGNFIGIPRAAFGVGEPKTATAAKMQFDSEEWQRGIVREYRRYVRNTRTPGSFQRYMEAERTIHA